MGTGVQGFQCLAILHTSKMPITSISYNISYGCRYYRSWYNIGCYIAFGYYRQFNTDRSVCLFLKTHDDVTHDDDIIFQHMILLITFNESLLVSLVEMIWMFNLLTRFMPMVSSASMYSMN